MKKFLLTLVAVLCVASAFAQFKVEQQQKMPEVVWQDGFRWVALYEQDLGNGEYYYMIGLRTSNQFDDKLLIHLGKREKAKATLLQLQNDLYEEGKTYNLSDDKGESFTLICSAFNIYHIYKDGYAGYGYIKLGQLPKMLSLFE